MTLITTVPNRHVMPLATGPEVALSAYCDCSSPFRAQSFCFFNCADLPPRLRRAALSHRRQSLCRSLFPDADGADPQSQGRAEQNGRELVGSTVVVPATVDHAVEHKKLQRLLGERASTAAPTGSLRRYSLLLRPDQIALPVLADTVLRPASDHACPGRNGRYWLDGVRAAVPAALADDARTLLSNSEKSLSSQFPR